jgi:hypothetical protein
MDLRRTVVNHLQNLGDAVGQFVAEPWPQYVQKMEQPGTFGDHLTLKAVATIYKVQIMVLSSLKTAYVISDEGDADGRSPSPPRFSTS